MVKLYGNGSGILVQVRKNIVLKVIRFLVFIFESHSLHFILSAFSLPKAQYHPQHWVLLSSGSQSNPLAFREMETNQ